MRVVIGLGGNALLRRGEPLEAEIQRRNVHNAMEGVARIAEQHDLVLTHGNGPQVGLLALQGESYPGVRPYPLDLLNAETEGMLGYLMEQELRNRLPARKVAGLLTLVEVAADDPAFTHPSKPIGPTYDHTEAQRLQQQYGWNVAPDGEGFRRVVPSPEPRRIIELPTIELLLATGAVVICAGGGGIPVIYSETEGLVGVEAVIDKDLVTALLAVQLKADRLLLLTDVDGVYADWQTKHPHRLDRITPHQLRAPRLAPGSMGPKAEAACRFVEQTGRPAGIGSLEEADEILEGVAGTQVSRTQ
jgi:carbamate kinase